MTDLRPLIHNRQEYGVINADGNSHLVLGNVYQQQAALTKEQKCCQTFKTSSYEDFKDRNPSRVPGTCQWVLNHPQFREWRSSLQSTLLWISADPGCGKSVLSKALVDDDLCGDGSSTVCYFFFKDNEEQDNLATALCALLHQLFSRQPHLLRHAIPAWERNGIKLRDEVQEMWRILKASASDPEAGSVICVMDALDECKDMDRRILIQLLCDLQQNTLKRCLRGGLKVLVTSRPYDSVQRWFEQATSKWPNIRLRGEDENDQIHQEINLVIGQRVQELTREFFLPSSVCEKIHKKLLNMQNRTYLWLHLAIEEVRATCRDSIYPDDIEVVSLPTSVEDAYERILCKIEHRQRNFARQVLLIIVAARRPLTIQDMAFALSAARASERKESFLNQIEPARLERLIPEQCGLFVFINHSQLFLIHQTAKEFLVAQGSDSKLTPSLWKSCLEESRTEYEMANICVTYLHLCHTGQFRKTECIAMGYEAIQINEVLEDFDGFWGYCATYWTSHLRDDFIRKDGHLLHKVLSLLTTNTDLFLRWFPFLWRMIEPSWPMPQLNDQHVIAIAGYVFALPKNLEDNDDLVALNSRDSMSNTVLQWAAKCGHKQMVQLLIDWGADVNAEKGWYGTALQAASEGGHDQTVQLLLNRGAKINADALRVASQEGHEQVVQILLDRGADVNGVACGIWTALGAASQWGHDQIVKMLLDRGADLSRPEDNKLALYTASEWGHLQIVQLLLNQGANVDTQGGWYGSALRVASWSGHEQIVQLLLDRGADVSNQEKNPEYGNALYLASAGGHKQIAQLLLDRGAEINASSGDYGSALQVAAANGREQMVQLLLDRGANVNASEGEYGNALQIASARGREQIVQLLLDRGAEINAL